jgi:hypothetical protein
MMFSAAGRDRALAYTLAAARTALCTWRAAHQSITIDEAHTFNFYVAGPWSNYYAQYIAHNHVLFSLLARFSVALFGTSELALRLPTVIAGLCLIMGAFNVLELSVPRAIRWIAITALSLHPLLLDFSVAARGYGLGLALLVWAMYFCMRARYALTGVLLGLAISAQLSMAVPAMAMILATVLLTRRIRPAAMVAALAGAVAFAICAIPLHLAPFNGFNYGYPTLRESLFSLVFPSTTDRAGLFIITHRAGVIAEVLVVLLIAGFLAIETIRELFRKTGPALLAPLAFLISSMAVVAAHYLVGANYPVDRTGLYLVLLFGLSWPIVVAGLESIWFRRLHLLLACLFAIQFASQFDAGSFRVWKFDMDTRRVAEILKQQCEGKPENSVTVSVVWINQQALEYYRRTLPIPALRPLEFHDPPVLAGYDFYVLNTFPVVRPPDELRVLFAGSESGIILAKNKAPRMNTNAHE